MPPKTQDNRLLGDYPEPGISNNAFKTLLADATTTCCYYYLLMLLMLASPDTTERARLAETGAALVARKELAQVGDHGQFGIAQESRQERRLG
jgi:hypothetical protein